MPKAGNSGGVRPAVGIGIHATLDHGQVHQVLRDTGSAEPVSDHAFVAVEAAQPDREPISRRAQEEPLVVLDPSVGGVGFHVDVVLGLEQLGELQRRYDLVPNLLATVKGYMRHESGVLERVTRLRGHPELDVTERASEESGLSRSIGRLFAVAEDYPDLKASEGFAQLHQSLVDIEEHLQFARRYYNGSVRDNNNLVEGFPSLLIARLFGFRSATFFEIELASQRIPPAIRFEPE